MSLAVSVLTPERLALQKQAEAIYFPASDGEMGVLNNHLPVLAQLKPGEVRILSTDGVDSFAISGGFVEVRNNNVFVFAETAEHASEINVERAKQAADQARELLREKSADIAVESAELALKRALVRLHVASHSRRKNVHGN